MNMDARADASTRCIRVCPVCARENQRNELME
jgi:hypothetical protein